MITGRANIIQWFKSLPSDENKTFRYWTIYPKGKTSDGWFAAKSPQDEGLTLQDSITALEKQLMLYSHGQYTIMASWSTGSAGKGGYKEDVEISPLEAAPVAAAVSGVQQPVNMSGYMSKQEAMEFANDLFERKMLERDLKDTKEKLAIVEKEKSQLEKNGDSIGKIIDMVAPYAPALIGKFIPMAAPAALAQVGTLHTTAEQPEQVMPTEDTQAQGQRLINLLEKCEAVFGVDDSVDFLEKLMNYVEQNPHFVSMIKGVVR